MVRLLLTIAVAALSFPAIAAEEPSVVVEKGPRDLSAYIKQKKTPKYLRIDIAGYHIRKTPEFSSKKTDNIDFTTNRGAMFAIRAMLPLENGVAVKVYVSGGDRWVYVPNSRRQDFQFCESEGCFSDLAEVIELLRKQNITASDLAACGVSLDSNGNLLHSAVPVSAEPTEQTAEEVAATEPVEAERATEEVETLAAVIPEDKRPVISADFRPELPKRRKDIPVPRNDPRKNYEEVAVDASTEEAPAEEVQEELPAASAPKKRVKHKAPTLSWSRSKPSSGKKWTNYLGKALDKFGKDLVNMRSLKDASVWCPNYSKFKGDKAHLRKEFWAHLLSNVALYESGHETNLTYDEDHKIHGTRPNPKRGKVHPDRFSQGLFQLSYESSTGYAPACNFDWKNNKRKDLSDPTLSIFDARKNIECAVGILNQNVRKHGGVAFGKKKYHRGGAAFWSTLRTNSRKSSLVLAAVKKDFPACGITATSTKSLRTLR